MSEEISDNTSKAAVCPSGSAADNVEFHEVRAPPDAHRRAGDDSDDVAFADQPFFHQAFLGDGGEAVNFLDVTDVARKEKKEWRNAEPCVAHWRKGYDRN